MSKHIDIYPHFHQEFTMTVKGTQYRIELVWSDFNGWTALIFSKNVPLSYGRSLRLDVDLFDGLNVDFKLIPKGEEPNRNNLGKGCLLVVKDV